MKYGPDSAEHQKKTATDVENKRLKNELVSDSLLMVMWRWKPMSNVTVHTDQGSQYTSHDWQNFLKAHNLEASLSRRGNCYDNAVAESSFQLLKRERIKWHIYSTRDDARSDIVDYIEMSYNNKPRHRFNDMLGRRGRIAQLGQLVEFVRVFWRYLIRRNCQWPEY